MAKIDKKQYVCPKCGNTKYDADKFSATGGAFAKVMDVQNKKFYTITCTKCGYTELYRGNSSLAGNIFDYFIGG